MEKKWINIAISTCGLQTTIVPLTIPKNLEKIKSMKSIYIASKDNFTLQMPALPMEVFENPKIQRSCKI